MKIYLLVLIGCLLVSSAQSQSELSSTDYRNFPLVVTLQFHSLSMPFRNIKSNFSNIGIGLGTEVSLNGKDNWAQQITAVWYRNKAVGNGLLFYTQTAWRPTIGSEFYMELKPGVGYLYSFRPVESYRQVKGTWTSAGHKGRGMLVLPAGITLGNHNYSSGTQLSPFVSYQFLILSGYSKSIPIVPETLVQVGLRVHP